MAAVFHQQDDAHTDAWLNPAIDLCLERATIDLDRLSGVAVTVGPGRFTGIRVGIATCLGLAAPRRLPVCAIQTLEALAEIGGASAAPVAACLDARRAQVYGAIYRQVDPLVVPLEPAWGPEACSPERFAEALSGFDEAAVLIGSGAPLLANLGSFAVGPDAPLLAAAAGRLAARAWRGAEIPDWPSPAPFYLRPPDARPPKNPLVANR